VEALLQQTINVAVTLRLIAKSALSAVIVDSTIRHKAIAYPTDHPDGCRTAKRAVGGQFLNSSVTTKYGKVIPATSSVPTFFRVETAVAAQILKTCQERAV